MKKIVIITGIVSYLLACGFQLSAAQTPFKVGLIAALTGKTSYAGTHMKIGAQIAVGEINKAGGIDGHPIELIIENDDSQGSKSASAAFVSRSARNACVASFRNANRVATFSRVMNAGSCNVASGGTGS